MRYKDASKTFIPRTTFDDKVFLLKSYPGLNASFLEVFLDRPLQGHYSRRYWTWTYKQRLLLNDIKIDKLRNICFYDLAMYFWKGTDDCL